MCILQHYGRVLLFGIFVIQAVVLSHYARLYALVLLVLPAIGIWFYIMSEKTKQLNWQWLVWLTYVIFLLDPMVILLFRTDLTKKLDKENFFGPNFLKITMCGAPAIALFLLTTADDSQQYGSSLNQLFGSIALDSFDEIELLEMLLHQEISSRLNTGEERSIIAFVCISFLLTALEMAEKKFDGEDMKLRSDGFYLWRVVLQLLLVNIPLLVIRLAVWVKYRHDASIFIAKNAIIIVTSLMEIMRLWIEHHPQTDRTRSPDDWHRTFLNQDRTHSPYDWHRTFLNQDRTRSPDDWHRTFLNQDRTHSPDDWNLTFLNQDRTLYPGGVGHGPRDQEHQMRRLDVLELEDF